MNKKQLLALALPVLLSASGLAVAKGGGQAASGSASKEGAPVAAHTATSPASIKMDKSTKNNASPNTGSTQTGSAQDPYSVPLFKDAKQLR